MKTWTQQKKGNLKRENKSLLIVAQNNALRTNYVQVKKDKTQKNSKCWLCNETINHIISTCSKLAQKSTRLGMTWWES